MKTTDGRDKDILDKQGVETDGKYREETLKDTPMSSNNVNESQQTPFTREDENMQKAKITVHTIEKAMTTTKERMPVSFRCGYNKAWSFYILDIFGALVMLLLPFTFDSYLGLDVLT